MDEPVDRWVCTVCHHGRPRGEVKASIAGNFANGECDNLGCPTRRDKGSKKRPPRQTVFKKETSREG